MAWRYEKAGSEGQPIVWLHGWGQDMHAFDRLRARFANGAQHLFLDQPGFGGTPMLPPGAGTADYAEALADDWPTYEIQAPAIFICHSFGARVATQFASRHPEKVKGLVFIGGAGLKRPKSLAFKLRAFGLRTLGRLARLSDRCLGSDYVSAYRRRFGSADYKAAGALRETFVKVVNEDLVAEAQSVRVPVLLIYGSDDSETPPSVGERFRSLIPGARLIILDGFGHLDILDRGVYQVESHVRAFLKELSE